MLLSSNFRYCNSHLQLISGGNKKEKKSKNQSACNAHNVQSSVVTKEQVNNVNCSAPTVVSAPSTISSMLDNKMTLEDRLKTKFNLCQKENGPEDEDLDDPYAFPDSEPVKLAQSPVQSGPPSLTESPPVNHVTVNNVGTNAVTTPNAGTEKGSISKVPTPENSNHGIQATVPMAKLYPELAEKLERARGKPEVKLKQESKSKSSRSSRTMNQLQTKIAQNKIKDKLKKNQGHSNQTTPEHQPSTPQPQLSPIPSGGSVNMPSMAPTALSPDPSVSPKVQFPCSPMNINAKNTLSNMLKHESSGAITSIPIGLPRHLIQHMPANTAAQTVGAQLQQQQQQYQQQLQQLHLSFNPAAQKAGLFTSVGMANHHLTGQQHTSPVHAASPPKVSLADNPLSMTPAAVASLVSNKSFEGQPSDHQVNVSPSQNSLAKAAHPQTEIPQQTVAISNMQAELSCQGVLPPPYPHGQAPKISHASQQASPERSQFIQQFRRQVSHVFFFF